MCGLTAIFSYGTKASLVDFQELQKITDSMIQRGPDGRGLWISNDKQIGLGHRRLSIIDLDDRASQPMLIIGRNGSKSKYIITFNGEIYNFKQLRLDLEAEGINFGTESDTEVILRLYERDGPDMVKKLRGMFALAIWDESANELFLARDPYGIKPLYYADNGQVFRAASQVKALLTGKNIDTSPNPAGHVGFFLFGSLPEPHTLFKNIFSFPAGCWMRIKKGIGREIFNYYDISQKLINSNHDLGPVDLREIIMDSIRHHFVADVPVGIFLSAGIDSTSLLGLATECQSSEIKTITLGFEEFRGEANDEVLLAEAAASQYGTQHHTAYISKADFDGAYDDIMVNMDQPTIDGINTYFVAREAKAQGLKVAISGLGGDELFGGYNTFKQVPELVNIMKIFPMHDVLGKLLRILFFPVVSKFVTSKMFGVMELGGSFGGAYFLRRGLYMPWEISGLMDPDMAEEGLTTLALLEKLNESCSSISEPLKKVAALESIFYLRNQLLRDSDWSGMAHSVEIRLPLVDSTLLEILAPSILCDGGLTKHQLAGTPLNSLPQSIMSRGKTGFSIPVEKWTEKANYTNDRGLRHWAKMVYASAISF